MVIAKCGECGNEYELEPGESPADFQCECGGNLKILDNASNVNSDVKKEPISVICPNCNKENEPSSKFCAFCGTGLGTKDKKTPKKPYEPLLAWWGKRDKTGKIVTVGVACLIGLLIIVGATGIFSQDTNKGTPIDVTIDQLYDSNIAKGTYVQVRGEVIESDGNKIRMRAYSSGDSRSDNDRRDILVLGGFAYEDDKIIVNGTFIGPYTYSTVMGGSRTIPAIESD
ncbi:zinc ribbon domain-containing protein [uncultured Methanobacterium sp.]|uniref:zinc ribbon domain-containing protein n=1 Tax=uncultured Methanobacterium sp. TaxID=176306 RepID=UPI002804A0E8|nr:zinc ribbon domain-containing protein [uncultured Methanobacterium sp.]